ncbi:MAG TPA: hypothetical protein VL241_09225, partial [Gemmatimonadales bacterium]|nr:hypothetical protein [Gemmatimonadales bacterium]
SPDPADHLLGLELEAVLRGFDPDPRVRSGGGLRATLDGEARRLSASSALHARAWWALGLLAARLEDTTAVRAARATLGAAESAGPLGRLLDAALAEPHDPALALRLLPVIPTLDQEADYADPLEDAVLHLLRAEAQVRLDSLGEAARTLRWHEHTQISGHLTLAPQPGELAWALGTLARWKRAQVLAASGAASAERCAVNRGVARLWAGGDPPFRARADSAARALAALQCAATP